MAKWKSEVVKDPPKDEDGFTKPGMTSQGQVVWVPGNRAAEGHQLCQKAAEFGKYPKDKAKNYKKVAAELVEKQLAHAKIHAA